MGNDQKNSGRHVRIAEDLFNGPRPRDQMFRACVSKDRTPPSTMALLIISSQINM
jgi:hypothetical protein